MSNAVQLFNFNNNQIRVVEIEGDPWFVAKDVCEVLGLSPDSCGSYSHNLRTLAMQERTVLEKRHGTDSRLFDGKRAARILCISESGLYKLVMRSDKPEARSFQDWVTKEVLPSIRKTGAYVVGQAPIATQATDPLAFAEIQMQALGSMITAMKEMQRVQQEQDKAITYAIAVAREAKKGNQFSQDMLTIHEFFSTYGIQIRRGARRSVVGKVAGMKRFTLGRPCGQYSGSIGFGVPTCWRGARRPCSAIGWPLRASFNPVTLGIGQLIPEPTKGTQDQTISCTSAPLSQRMSSRMPDDCTTL